MPRSAGFQPARGGKDYWHRMAFGGSGSDRLEAGGTDLGQWYGQAPASSRHDVGRCPRNTGFQPVTAHTTECHPVPIVLPSP
ncbi:MAG: hypothetical protein AAFR61_23045, partial [Bacteroidota bacterium]